MVTTSTCGTSVTFPLTSTAAANVWTVWSSTGTSTTFDTESHAIWTSWTGTETNSVTTTGTYESIVWNSWVDGEGQPQQHAVPAWRPDPNAALKRKIVRRRSQRGIVRAANQLLQSILSEAEWEEWRRYDSVRVVGSEGGVYEVGVGWEGMLYKLGVNGEPEQKLCCHPPTSYPTGDRVATMILALRTNEAEIIRKANVHHFSDADKQRVRARRAHRLRRVA